MEYFRNYILVLWLFCAGSLPAQEEIPLWPEKKMPNSKGMELADSIAEERLYRVGYPRLYAFPAPEEINTGAAILIVPGGGYRRIPSDYSQNTTARFYQERGINAFVLCYRLPTSPDLLKPEIAPLQDVQRAMRIIRHGSGKWGIKPECIGISGTSAGGHAAASAGVFPEDVSSIGDLLDEMPYRPAFMILVSPVISFDDQIAHMGSRSYLLGDNPSDHQVYHFSCETQVTGDTPPALLIHADNDTSVSPLNSIVFYQALKAAGVSSSLHIFPFGAHRLSIRNNPGSAALWPEISIKWLTEMRFIE